MDTTTQTQICRLCGCGENTECFLNVFDKDENGKQIVTVIREYLRIIIYRHDPLSKSICKQCNDLLCNLQKLHQSALEIADKYRSTLTNRNNLTSKELLYLNTLKFTASKEEQHNNITALRNAETNTDDIIDDDDNLMGELLNADSLHSINGFTDNTSNSDMELCDAEETLNTPIITDKKRKTAPVEFCGPKFTKKHKPDTTTIARTIYNPLTLLELVILHYNRTNLSNFTEDHYLKTVEYDENILENGNDEINECIYCNVEFQNLSELAIHELNSHIRLNLEKVDSKHLWKEVNTESVIRNKWMADNQLLNDGVASTTSDEVVENDLLVPLETVEHTENNEPQKDEEEEGGEEEQQLIDTEQSLEIVFVGDEATIQGVPLIDCGKGIRSALYKTYSINGVKRKFCKHCRYSFKDNWAIEYHYISRACYYSCKYCGIRFNKNKASYPSHVAGHEQNGDSFSKMIFLGSRTSSIPQILPSHALKPYIPSPGPHMQKAKMPGINLKSLFAKKRGTPINKSYKTPITKCEKPVTRTQTQTHPPKLGAADLKVNTQAYFCKKCFQVFSNMNEFTPHIKTCTGEISDPEFNMIRHYTPRRSKADKDLLNNVGKTPANKNNKAPIRNIKQEVTDEVKEEFMYSSSGRPLRNCVKEVSYQDDMNDLLLMKFACNFCGEAFPSAQSKNNHMRIHKFQAPPKQLQQDDKPISTNMTKVKQEMFEPIVDIHEGPSTKITSSVSITPVNKKTMLSPAIMKLVQNNPNITLKTSNEVKRTASPHTPQQHLQQGRNSASPSLCDSGDRSYKCSSCFSSFANKSNLYFHKKNQCGGSKYPCPFCKKRFGTESAYSSHIYYSHPE